MTIFSKRNVPSFFSITPLQDAYILASMLLICFSHVVAQHSVVTDRSNAIYELGETVKFQIDAATSGTATYEIITDKHTAPLKKGTVQIQAGQSFSLTFTPTESVVVMCKVKKNGETRTASAAIAPFALLPIEEEPTDFDAFWEEARQELAQIPIDPQLAIYRETDYSTTYRINIATIDSRRVYGYISVPKMEGSFPAVLTLPAYGSIANVVTPAMFIAEQAGALSLAISIHNTEPDQVDPNSYKPNNIMNPYTNYYRYAVLACIRAIDYLHTRADFNGELAVSGVSQGGGLSLMTAGLDERVDLLVYSNASHCEHTGKKYEKASGFPYYLNQARLMYDLSEQDESDIVEACKYYDAAYFASRYEGASLGFISYQDDVSPPTTTFKAFNVLKGKKVLMHGTQLRHEHPQEYWVGRYDALRRFLPSSVRAPWPYARKTTGYLLDIGEDQIVQVGTNLRLEPTLVQNDENIDLPVQWKMLSGPTAVVFSDMNSLTTNARFDVPGTYLLEVRARDEALLEEKNRFYSITDQITIHVHNGEHLPLLVDCNAGITLFTNNDSAIANWALPTTTSTCDGNHAEILQVEGLSTGSAFPVGRTQIVYQITDACGNQKQCAFFVTVIKETLNALEVACPNDIELYTSSSSAIGNWPLPTVLSICGSTPATFTQTAGFPLGSAFPLGATAVTYQITDACGQETSCTFMVNVLENRSPLVISCPDDITVTTTGNIAIPTWELPEIVSTCSTNGAVQYSQTSGPVLGNPFPVGDTPIRYIVTDECGQQTPCSFTVSVIQVEQAALSIVCPDDIQLTTSTGSSRPSWELPEILSACGMGIQYVQTKGPDLGSVFPVGNTVVEYEVTDGCGQRAYCTFTVEIRAEEVLPLAIACPFNLQVHIIGQDTSLTWELPQVLSTCNNNTAAVTYTQVSGPEIGSRFALGSTRITYKVEDACGQTDYCSFNIELIQGTPRPLVVECPTDMHATLPIGVSSSEMTWPLPKVSSFCSDELVVSQVQGPPNGSRFWKGKSTIKYLVRDGCGNVAYCSFEIEITDVREIETEIDAMSISRISPLVRAYPNPTHKQLNVAWTSTQAENVALRITNTLGQTTYAANQQATIGSNKWMVEVSHLMAGCYVWEIRSDKGWQVAKSFIKQ
ncbi:MAG: HYR domain-containing protein [Bacteroidota bacterium]